MSDSRLYGALFSSGFDKALRRAQRNRILDAVRGRSHRLLPFDIVSSRLHVRQQIDLGLRVVPLDHIIGTVGKLGEFDRSFLPMRPEGGERWRRVEHAFRDGTALPPVQLYKAWDIYFVIDGHHRVSVARQQGASDIEARVQELIVDVPLMPDLTLNDLDTIEQESDFYQWTNLRQLRPDADIQTSHLDAHLDLIVRIQRHRVALSERRGEDVGVSEAVADWYDHVYMPVVALVRQRNLLDAMPRRTEADLYINIVNYQDHLVAEIGQPLSLEDTLDVYGGYVPASNTPWGRLGRRRIHVLPPSATRDTNLLARLRRKKHTNG